jgi:hypothetical protein
MLQSQKLAEINGPSLESDNITELKAPTPGKAISIAEI